MSDREKIQFEWEFFSLSIWYAVVFFCEQYNFFGVYLPKIIFWLGRFFLSLLSLLSFGLLRKYSFLLLFSSLRTLSFIDLRSVSRMCWPTVNP